MPNSIVKNHPYTNLTRRPTGSSVAPNVLLHTCSDVSTWAHDQGPQMNGLHAQFCNILKVFQCYFCAKLINPLGPKFSSNIYWMWCIATEKVLKLCVKLSTVLWAIVTVFMNPKGMLQQLFAMIPIQSRKRLQFKGWGIVVVAMQYKAYGLETSGYFFEWRYLLCCWSGGFHNNPQQECYF